MKTEIKKSLLEINEILVNKIIERVEITNKCDEGLTLFFTDGSNISYGYSRCEGSTSINDMQLDLWSIREQTI